MFIVLLWMFMACYVTIAKEFSSVICAELFLILIVDVKSLVFRA